MHLTLSTLLDKLSFYGVSGIAKMVFKLRNRQKYVQIQGTKSNFLTVKSGFRNVLSLDRYYSCFI